MNRELQAYAGLYLPLGGALRMERMVTALPMGGRVASNGRKGRFQSLEAGLLMGGRTGWDYGLPYTELVDRGDYKITGLHPVFGALDF